MKSLKIIIIYLCYEVNQWKNVNIWKISEQHRKILRLGYSINVYLIYWRLIILVYCTKQYLFLKLYHWLIITINQFIDIFFCSSLFLSKKVIFSCTKIFFSCTFLKLKFKYNFHNLIFFFFYLNLFKFL